MRLSRHALAPGQLFYEGRHGALELRDRRVVDALKADRAVQPRVDLAVTASVTAVQFADEATALAA
jgi:hypothetical protein